MLEITLHNYESYLLDYFESRLNPEQITQLRNFLLLHPELEINLDEDLPVLEKDNNVFEDKSGLKHFVEFEDERLISYLEGLMSPLEEKRFEDLLSRNERLSHQLLEFRKTILPKETMVPDFKSVLFKSEQDLELNQPALLYIEGELTKAEEEEFLRRTSTEPELKKELGLLIKTKLQPDLSIVFEAKQSLKKEALLLPLFGRPLYRFAAAAILILLGIGLIFRYFAPNEPQNSNKLLSRIHNKITTPKSGSSNTTSNTGATGKISSSPENSIANLSIASKKLKKTHSVQRKKNKVEEKIPVQSQGSEPETQPSNSQPDLGELKFAASAPSPASAPLQKYISMIPFEEDTDSDTISNNASQKRPHGFWHLVTSMAKRANKMGLKSVNGREEDQNHYLLSFNSFSIEKK